MSNKRYECKFTIRLRTFCILVDLRGIEPLSKKYSYIKFRSQLSLFQIFNTFETDKSKC